MNELPSKQFRTTFHRLTEPTVVTALGRPIGTYIPLGVDGQVPPNGRFMAATRDEKITQLSDEIAHLKRELAKRPIIAEGSLGAMAAAQRVAKEQVLSPEARRARQKAVDEALAKINRRSAKGT